MQACKTKWWYLLGIVSLNFPPHPLNTVIEDRINSSQKHLFIYYWQIGSKKLHIPFRTQHPARSESQIEYIAP